jgi:hypothetical protein
MKIDYRFVAPCALEEIKAETAAKKLSDRKLFATCYNNAVLVPSKRFIDAGVLDEAGKTIAEGAFLESCKVRHILPTEEVTYRDEVVIYLGILHNVWGHCLTDAFKKVWFLHTEECRQWLTEGAKLVFLLPDNEGLRNYAKHLYELANIDLRQLIPVREVTRFRQVIIPDNSIVGTLSKFRQWKFSYTPEFVDVFNTIKSNLLKKVVAGTETFKKIYLTRTGIDTKGREYGEKTLETLFRKMGFQVISPEKYSLEQQYYLLSHCEELAVTEGSISHSAIFCRPGTKLILLRKSYYVNGYQTIINEVADLDVTYIDAHRSLPEMQYAAMYGPFYMCVTPELERFVGHRIPHLPLWLRPSWWWFCNRNRKIVHRICNFLGYNLSWNR